MQREDARVRAAPSTIGRLNGLAARRAFLLAYLIPSIVSLIAVQTWFDPGTVIGSGDLPPPISPEANYTAHWSHLTAGEGAPTYDVVNLPYAAWLDAWTWLGASEELAQRLWLSALFAGSAAAVVFLAFGFTTSAIAAGTAGLLASFNVYRLVIGPDAVPMAAILVAALLGGIVVRVAFRPERRPSVLLFAVASLGLGYVMANPPHVALVALWVAACTVVVLAARPDAVRRTLGYLARAVPLALLFNAWWIVAAWLTLTAPGFADRFAAANVDDWAWTHERANLTNALTLNTFWSWDHAEYFPYAAGLGNPPFDLFKYALPILAVVGVVLAWRDNRRIAIGLAVVALVAAWLTTGFNAPLPGVNRWLYDEFPGYWLFREPSKILLLVLLPVAILAGLGVQRLLEGTGRASRIGLALVAAALVYVHPLFTGEVVADDRPLLPSAHVRVPDAWSEAAATLNAQSGAGKVFVLPRSDFYQVPTTWGYYGVPFTRSIIRRPVLEAQPGSYFRPVSTVSSLEESVEQDLVAGRTAEARKALAALGVRFILLRRDVDAAFPDREITRPNTLARRLKRTPGVRLVRSFGMLDLYRLRGSIGEVFPATPVLFAGAEETIARAVVASPGTPGFVSGQDDQRSLLESGVRPRRLVRFEEDRIRRLAVRRQGGTVRVRLVDPFRLTIGKQRLRGFTAERISVRVPRTTPVLVTAGPSVLPLRRIPRRWQDLGVHGLRPDEAVSVWRRADKAIIGGSAAGSVQDCSAGEAGDPEETGIRAKVFRLNGREALRLAARSHSACVSVPLVSERSQDVYRVRFRYRQRSGNLARVCLWQTGLKRCAPAPLTRATRSWRTFDASVRPHSRATGLSLVVYADGLGEPPATVTEYAAIRLERYRRAAVMPRRTARVATLRGKPSAARTLAYTPPSLPPAIDLASTGPVGDCHRFDERSSAQLGLAAEVKPVAGARVLELRARAHAACVNFTISSEEPPARTYRIQFEYRRVSGSRPRACLWQEGPDLCAAMARLENDSEWRVFDDTVELADAVDGLHLFFYADGGDEQPTVVQYRKVRVGPLASVALLGVPRERPLPRVVAHRDAPWKLTVRVRNARGPFLLATSDAFASGWKASVDGVDDSGLRHVEVNGYANGWLVPFRGSYEMTLEYGPERYARAARWLSVIALIGALGWVGLRRLRAFDVRWHTR